MSDVATSPLHVVEISSGMAGAYCGWLLAEMGARVSRLVAHDPDPSRDDPMSLALEYLALGKRETGASDLAEAITQAQIVVCDDIELFARVTGSSFGEFAARNPETVFGASSVFGMTGPLADVPAVPINAQAEAGVAWALGEAGREPLTIPPGILECQAGAHLAAACLAARRLGPAGDDGRIVDIALADILAHYVGVNCRFYIHHGMEWRREGRRAAYSGGAYPFVILPCADGAVCLSGRTRPEWERFVEAMGRPDWTQEERYNRLRAMGQEYPEEVDALVMPWLADHTKAQIEEIADRFRLTIAPLRDLAEVLDTPQFAHRDFLKSWKDGERELVGFGLPFRVAAQRSNGQQADEADSLLARAAPAAAPDQPLPFSGLRVLDLGWVWSAPQVGSILAQMGAEVIKVEHSKRPDNSRLSGYIIRDGKRIEGQTMDMSPMFHQINKGKLGITLNLKEPEGIVLLKRISAQCDIVLENMSAGSLERSGIGYDTLSAENRGLIMVAMSGAGQFGPASDMRTYAPTMSSFVGLESLVGYRNQAPTGALNFAIGDPNAAIHALVARLAALERREATGAGCYIDLSQTEALLSTLLPYALEAQLEGEQPMPIGNDHPAMAPHGIYQAEGEDNWVALAIRDDSEWQAFRDIVGSEDRARDSRFATLKGRIAARSELDELVSEWTRGQDPGSLVASLRQAGIPASVVNDIDGLWRSEQIAARGMADTANLPGLGEEMLFQAPWTISGLQVERETRGPVIGEHNERVLRDWLGLGEAEFARLSESGVIS